MKAVRFTDPDEQYVFDERIGILAEDQKPTDEQIALAIADVWRFRNERFLAKRAKKQDPQIQLPL